MAESDYYNTPNPTKKYFLIGDESFKGSNEYNSTLIRMMNEAAYQGYRCVCTWVQSSETGSIEDERVWLMENLRGFKGL